MILAPTLSASAGSGAAIVRPTFSRDFAGEKSLNNGTGPAITFTRGSNATYFNAAGTLTTATTNEPRFDHNPSSGNASLGLLIEESRTNVLPASVDLTNGSYWSVDANVTRTANQGTAPDGTSTATRLVFAAANEALFRDATLDVSGVGTYTTSWFLKAGAADQIGETISVGIGNGTDGFNEQPVTLSNQWQRISSTKTTSASSTLYVSINNANAVTATNVLVWGAQLEAGAFPTSYIPTTTAAATRAADFARVTPISSFYNQAEGTLFAEATTDAFAAYRYLASFSNGTSLADRNFDMSKATGNVFEGYVQTGGAMQAALSSGQTWVAGINRSIMAARTDDVATSQNGASVLTDTSATIPTNLDRLSIGSRPDGATLLNGHIRKVAYWPKRLTNTLLEQLTT